MHCQRVTTPTGPVIICGPCASNWPPCHHCGQPSTRLCDKTVSRVPFRTCDRPLCTACAIHRPGNVDYCRDHNPAGARI